MSYARKLMMVGVVLSVFLTGGVLLSGEAAWAAQSQGAKAAPKLERPFALKELVKLVKHNKKHLKTIVPAVESRGVAFEVTADIEKKLRKAGADDAFVITVKSNTPSAIAARASQAKGGFTKEESEAYNQIKYSNNPDEIIAAATDYAKKYPKSSLLTYVYGMEATAYQQKNDLMNAVKFGQKSLILDSDNLMSLLLVSYLLPQPQMLNVPDAMKANRLKLAELYATKALQKIDTLPKLPAESDDAYAQRKNQASSGAYASLGLVHLERSGMSLTPPDMEELGKAEENYKLAIQKSPNPNPGDYYRLGETYAQEGKLDDAIAAFTKAGQLAPGSVIQQYSDRQINALKDKKAHAGAAAKK